MDQTDVLPLKVKPMEPSLLLLLSLKVKPMEPSFSTEILVRDINQVWSPVNPFLLFAFYYLVPPPTIRVRVSLFCNADV